MNLYSIIDLLIVDPADGNLSGNVHDHYIPLHSTELCSTCLAPMPTSTPCFPFSSTLSCFPSLLLSFTLPSPSLCFSPPLSPLYLYPSLLHSPLCISTLLSSTLPSLSLSFPPPLSPLSLSFSPPLSHLFSLNHFFLPALSSLHLISSSPTYFPFTWPKRAGPSGGLAAKLGAKAASASGDNGKAERTATSSTVSGKTQGNHQQ